jgi:hypothetical protein
LKESSVKTVESSIKAQVRQDIAAEVLELGEMLFDTAIDMEAQLTTQDKASEAALIEELRAAADEFFTVLRLLLEIGQDTGERNR